MATDGCRPAAHGLALGLRSTRTTIPCRTSSGTGSRGSWPSANFMPRTCRPPLREVATVTRALAVGSAPIRS